MVVNVHSGAATTAWLALGFSLLTLAWQVAELLVRWPRLGVQLRQTVFVTATLTVNVITSATATVQPAAKADPTEQPSKPQAAPSKPEPGNGDRFDIVVVNGGAEATTVVNVGIQSVDGSRSIDVQRERDDGKVIRGPELPARIEEHGALVWVIEPELTSRFPRGTELIGYMHQYRRYHKYPKSRRNMVRLYKSPHHYVKN